MSYLSLFLTSWFGVGFFYAIFSGAKLVKAKKRLTVSDAVYIFTTFILGYIALIVTFWIILIEWVDEHYPKNIFYL